MSDSAVRTGESLHPSGVELRSAPWKRAFATLVFGFIGFFAVGAVVGAIAPRIAWVQTEGENPTFLLVSGIATFAFCVFCWLRTVRHHLHADEEGMIERTGVRTTRVRWSDVAFYRLERVRGTNGRLMWPVLYGGDGRELLRPVFPFVVGTRKDDRDREAFWRYVEERLEGKRHELPPTKPFG